MVHVLSVAVLWSLKEVAQSVNHVGIHSVIERSIFGKTTRPQAYCRDKASEKIQKENRERLYFFFFFGRSLFLLLLTNLHILDKILDKLCLLLLATTVVRERRGYIVSKTVRAYRI